MYRVGGCQLYSSYIESSDFVVDMEEEQEERARRSPRWILNKSLFHNRPWFSRPSSELARAARSGLSDSVAMSP